MSLFPELPEIDEGRTVENVRNYFDNEFPRIVDRCSFSSSLIKSPVFDITGVKSSSGDNSQERKLFKLISNEDNQNDRFVEETAKAIQKLSEPYKTILVNVYFKGTTNLDVYRDMKYGPTRYSELKRTAFLKFADKFEPFYNLNITKNKDNSDKSQKAKTS